MDSEKKPEQYTKNYKTCANSKQIFQKHSNSICLQVVVSVWESWYTLFSLTCDRGTKLKKNPGLFINNAYEKVLKTKHILIDK